MVGYCQKIGQKKGSATILDGLGFKININTDPLNHFTINNIERGLYEKSRLMDFGEKHFSNGNFYIGNFINNTFHGKGVLVNPKEKKWTIGEYSNGELVNL